MIFRAITDILSCILGWYMICLIVRKLNKNPLKIYDYEFDKKKRSVVPSFNE